MKKGGTRNEKRGTRNEQKRGVLAMTRCVNVIARHEAISCCDCDGLLRDDWCMALKFLNPNKNSISLL